MVVKPSAVQLGTVVDSVGVAGVTSFITFVNEAAAEVHPPFVDVTV